MTENTLDEENDAGRIRQHDNILIMDGITGDVAHTPPHHEELPNLLADLETFFNKDGKTFIHPIIKGIIIHFMLAYFHPFVDGNERTARSLFYWYMLKRGIGWWNICLFHEPYTRPKGTMKKPTSIQNMTTTI